MLNLQRTITAIHNVQLIEEKRVQQSKAAGMASMY
jgi:hypothetical protein